MTLVSNSADGVEFILDDLNIVYFREFARNNIYSENCETLAFIINTICVKFPQLTQRCLQQDIESLLTEFLGGTIENDVVKKLLFDAASKLEVEKKKFNRENSRISNPFDHVQSSSPQNSSIGLISNRETSSISNIPILS